jgi:hypothetical protein
MLSNFRSTIPSLTAVIQVLEGLQDFEPKFRAGAITFYASEIATQYAWQQETAELHLYRISSYIGVEVTLWN